jgi:hypothetical protein
LHKKKVGERRQTTDESAVSMISFFAFGLSGKNTTKNQHLLGHERADAQVLSFAKQYLLFTCAILLYYSL